MSEDEREEKDIVRGYNFAEYHADVYDKTESEVTGAGLDCECLGGGRIEHKPQEKYIKVLPKIRDVWNGHSHLHPLLPGLWIQYGIWKGKSCPRSGDPSDEIQRL